MQLAAVQPLLAWHGIAAAQDCSPTAFTPSITSQDAGEGTSDAAPPIANTTNDPDVPDTSAGKPLRAPRKAATKAMVAVLWALLEAPTTTEVIPIFPG